MKRLIKRVDAFFYHLETRLLLPVLLHYFPPRRREPKKDVLHIGYLTTKPRIICGALRKKGVKADYLAFTHRFSNSSWLKTDDAGADYIINPFLPLDCLGFFGEFRRLRGMLLNYKAVHCHFLRFSSVRGWELPILKSAGVRIVVHYRGCDIRFPEFYEKKQVECCACYECDYPDDYCSNSRKTELRRLASEYGDLFLVTTPDLLDFTDDAVYLPFFPPAVDLSSLKPNRKSDAEFEIVHSTNHRGIDGTSHIQEAVERLKKEGYSVYLHILEKMPYLEALSYYKGADVSVGKLMMGFYGNAQVESILAGTPAIARVRDDLREYVGTSIFPKVTPDNLFALLKSLLDSPKRSHELWKRQYQWCAATHDGKALADRLVELYALDEDDEKTN